MTEEPDTAVVCHRVHGTTAEQAPDGAKVALCADCEQEVWLDPRGQPLVEQGIAVTLCAMCAYNNLAHTVIEGALGLDDPPRVEVIPNSREELDEREKRRRL